MRLAHMIALFCGLALTLAAETVKDDHPAVVLSVEGAVQMQKNGSNEWTKAAREMIMAPGDRLRTGARSRAAVRLFDASVIRIAPLTTFELVARDEKKPWIDLKGGSLYFFSRQRPEDVRFRTPTISGAIRGTEFILQAAPNGASELALFEGEVELRQADSELILHSGEVGLAPTPTELKRAPLINAVNRMQWVLYYPAVLDPAELGALPEARESVRLYEAGNLPAAADRLELPAAPSPALALFSAALDLAFGEAGRAQTTLARLPDSPARRGLERMIAAVQFQKHPFTNAPASASEWMGESYYLQSIGQLAQALRAAEHAAQLSPGFGFAWVRVAELEFAHGRTEPALAALEKGLELSPLNAQAYALRGYIYAANYRKASALASFDRAIELDGGLGAAWLGRGLVKMKLGEIEAGRRDIQTAVALEPQRAVFRAYLAKSFAEENRPKLAEKDFRLAQELDPGDPTAWLYSGVFHFQQNRVNSAITDLQTAARLNDNQQIHRSTFLLDQDRATQSANLASVYRDAAMLPVSFSQASRAVTDDYANYSTHLFLAQSYDLLRDPNKYNLRYETARLSELYLASLLSPVGGFSLSQNVGNQDATRLFEQNRFGLSSETEYLSRGAWSETGSQFGTFDRFAYSVDGFYRSDAGQRFNNDIEQRTLSLQAKYQLTARDSVYLQALHYESESGDVVQRYDPRVVNPDVRVRETHEPDAFLGFHHEWQPGVHTLLFAGRSDLTLQIDDPDVTLLFFRRQNGEYTRIQPAPWHRLDYDRGFELYSAEAQQIWQNGRQTYIAGVRYQTAETEVSSHLTDIFEQPRSIQEQENDFYRLSIYGYYQWQLLDSLQLTAGLSYDQLHYPRNIDTAPVSNEETGQRQLSPKAGLLFNPWRGGNFRAAFTRSLGGLSLDNNLRLEPTQVGGFNQAYRSLIPESVAGIAAGEEFQTVSVGYDHAFSSGTFAGVAAEHLSSHAGRWFGILTSSGFLPVPDTPANTVQQLEFTERSLRLYGYQLIGREFAAGVNYQIAQAELESRLAEVPATLPERSLTLESTLQQLGFTLAWNHPSGFFALGESTLYSQHNVDALPGPGDEFWQHNFYVGYRFRRRAAEIRLGVLNVANQDYRLNPLNSYLELPRERTFTARLRLNF